MYVYDIYIYIHIYIYICIIHSLCIVLLQWRGADHHELAHVRAVVLRAHAVQAPARGRARVGQGRAGAPAEPVLPPGDRQGPGAPADARPGRLIIISTSSRTYVYDYYYHYFLMIIIINIIIIIIIIISSSSSSSIIIILLLMLLLLLIIIILIITPITIITIVIKIIPPPPRPRARSAERRGPRAAPGRARPCGRCRGGPPGRPALQ